MAGAFDGLTKKSNKTFTYAGVKGQLNKHVNLGGFYARRNAHKSSGDALRNMYGFSTDMNFDKVWGWWRMGESCWRFSRFCMDCWPWLW